MNSTVNSERAEKIRMMRHPFQWMTRHAGQTKRKR